MQARTGLEGEQKMKHQLKTDDEQLIEEEVEEGEETQQDSLEKKS